MGKLTYALCSVFIIHILVSLVKTYDVETKEQVGQGVTYEAGPDSDEQSKLIYFTDTL